MPPFIFHLSACKSKNRFANSARHTLNGRAYISSAGDTFKRESAVKVVCRACNRQPKPNAAKSRPNPHRRKIFNCRSPNFCIPLAYLPLYPVIQWHAWRTEKKQNRWRAAVFHQVDERTAAAAAAAHKGTPRP
jgi:hypothetical protein